MSAPAPLSVAAAVADLVTMAEAAALSGAAVLSLAEAKTKKSPSKKVKKQGSSGKLGAKEKRKENVSDFLLLLVYAAMMFDYLRADRKEERWRGGETQSSRCCCIFMRLLFDFHRCLVVQMF